MESGPFSIDVEKFENTGPDGPRRVLEKAQKLPG